MYRIVLTSALCAAAAAPAFAGNPYVAPAEPVVAVPAPVAVAPAGVDWTGPYAGVQLGYGNISPSTGGDEDGVVGGAHVGYDYDFGSYVLGVGADYEATDIEIGATSIDSIARLKAKAGVEVGRSLLYGTAGAAYLDSSAGSDDGYFAGLGMDYAINDRWSVGGEVLYHQFDDFNGTGTDFDATTATAKVSLRF